MSNLLRNICCDNCPDYDPCEDCGEIKCPENSGTCCPKPQLFQISKVVEWVYATYREFKAGLDTQEIPASELFGGSGDAKIYYRKNRTWKWSGLKYSSKQYPVCCRGGVVDKYEEGFRRCPESWAWYYDNVHLTNHKNPSSPLGNDARFTGYISNPCTCETLINNDALANGAFSPNISMKDSPLGGRTFYAVRELWLTVH